MKLPKRLFPGNDDSPPPGQLRWRIKDLWLKGEIRAADVVMGIDPGTGEENGLYYGAAALGRIVRRDTPEEVRVLKVPVDPDTDDVEVLCAMVQAVKGAHCYPETED